MLKQLISVLVPRWNNECAAILIIASTSTHFVRLPDFYSDKIPEYFFIFKYYFADEAIHLSVKETSD